MTLPVSLLTGHFRRLPFPPDLSLPVCKMTTGPLRPCPGLRFVYLKQPHEAGPYLILYTDVPTGPCPQLPKPELRGCLATEA